jgi:hypothetical protein
MLAPKTLYRVSLNNVEERQMAEALTAQLRPTLLTASTNPVAAKASLAIFPGMVRQLDAAQNNVELKLYAFAGQSLTLDPATGEYVGSVRVGVTDPFEPQVRHALSVPMVFDVLESGLARPPQLEISQTSPPMGTFWIHTATFADPFTVHVVSQSDPNGIAVTLPMNKTLFVKLDRRAMQGFGLETADVEVSTVLASFSKPGPAATLPIPN